MSANIYVQKDKKIKQARKKGIDFSHYQRWTTRKHTLRQTKRGGDSLKAKCHHLRRTNNTNVIISCVGTSLLLVNTGQGVQSGCTSRKRGQSEKWVHFWISVGLMHASVSCI